MAIFIGLIVLIILLRRDSREQFNNRARRAIRGASQLFTSDGSHAIGNKSGGMSKAAVEELRFHLPTNQLRAAPLSRAASLSVPERQSRPSTAASHFSETFRRSWHWKPNKSKRIPAPGGSPAPTFWVGKAERTGPLDENDVEWRPPNDWDVATPVASDSPVPAVPIPAFLKPPMPVDARSIDPSSFPLPLQAAAAGRWSTSQSSHIQGYGASSVAGDSVFCTCDMDDIPEEQPSPAYQKNTRARMSTTGSSIHTRQGRCRACLRRSALENNAGNHTSMPGTPLTLGFSRNSSVRRPRRKRVPETASRTKINVAGRLYQGE